MGRRVEFESTANIIRIAHALPIDAVQEAAVALFWYFVYRLNGKISQKEHSPDAA